MRIDVSSMAQSLTRAAALAVVFALAACATAPAAGPTIERLSGQQFAPTQTVDVLTAAPQRAFVRIARLTLANPTGTATRGQLIAQLTSTAQGLGADAIVVEHVAQATGAAPSFNPSGGQMQQQPGDQAPLSVTVLALHYTR